MSAQQMRKWQFSSASRRCSHCSQHRRNRSGSTYLPKHPQLASLKQFETYTRRVRSLPARSAQRKGGNHAKIGLMGGRYCGCFGGRDVDRRSFASRRHRTTGPARGRRSASSHGNCPVHFRRPALLLVQRRMAGPRLVPVWLSAAARLGLGWPARVARVATASRAPGHSSVEANSARAPTPATTSRQGAITCLPAAAGWPRQAPVVISG